MTEVFADSFYWIALLNPADAFHDTVRNTPVSGRIVTSLAVQLEVLDAFSAYPALRPAAIRFWERTTHDPQVTVIPLTAEVIQDAIDLFRRATTRRGRSPTAFLSRSCGSERLLWRCPRTTISGRQASRRRSLDVAVVPRLARVGQTSARLTQPWHRAHQSPHPNPLRAPPEGWSGEGTGAHHARQAIASRPSPACGPRSD